MGHKNQVTSRDTRFRTGFTPLQPEAPSFRGGEKLKIREARQKPRLFSRVVTGFTLLEMIVSFGIFSALMIIAIGAVISINGAQIKASNVQAILDNLRFSLETMTKEMRTGTGLIPRGQFPAYDELYFTRASDGATVGYCLQDTVLQKVIGSTSCDGSAVTGDDVVVESLVFYVIGQDAGPTDGQPRITVLLKARSKDPKLQTTFQLQTTLTPRPRDL